jgi:hypothetical protein
MSFYFQTRRAKGKEEKEVVFLASKNGILFSKRKDKRKRKK